MTSKIKIAKALLKIKAVFLRPENPFTWASGIKSPIYCDNRLILSYPEERKLVEDSMSELIRTSYPDAEAIMGTATAGIAHAAMTAERLGLPMGYVRSSAKDHGRKNQIEGRIEAGQKVVVVEDLISTASSVLECVNALRDEGANVLGIASIFTYSMKRGIMNLKEAGITNNSLCDLDTLLRIASDEGYITPDDVTRILKFRDNPSDESWRN
jgi:orotate phosphoribosyltransferase